MLCRGGPSLTVERLARDSVRTVCHVMPKREAAAEGSCDLLVGAHDGQAQMGWAGHRGEHLGIGLLLDVIYVYVYMPCEAKSIDIVSPRPLIRTPVTSSPIITYTHGPDVRLSPVLSLFTSALPLRLVSSGHITVTTVPSLRPTTTH